MSEENKDNLENNKNAEQPEEKQDNFDYDTVKKVSLSDRRRMLAAKKRQKDQFSVTLTGMIVYAVILIAIVAGTYLGIRTLFSRYAAKTDTVDAVNLVEEPVQEESAGSENEVPTESALAEEAEEETPMEENLIDVSALVSGENNYIDYSQTLFKPAKRNAALTWEDTVFSRLENVKNPAEAAVNSYQFSRKFASREDDKQMEFDVYTNPENGRIEKITAVEYCGDDIETIDYYYDNGKINYIAQHRSLINTPIDISSSAVQSRYYFNDDVMVKYSYCEGNKATEYVITDLSKYSEGTVDQYDYLEQTMLNWAYINYNVVKNIAESEKIEGYVLDEFNTAMADAEVQLSSDSGNVVVAKTTTNGDGYYSLIMPINNSDTYTLTIKKNTLDEVKVYGITAESGASVYAVEPVYLSYTEVGAIYNVQIMVRDAKNVNTALSDATIKLRNGINNYEGDVIATGTLDSTGAITAPMRAGSYTAEISKGGYETSYFTVIVRMDRQAVLGYAVPDVGENQFETVLSWDATPLDLDARVFSSNAAKVNRAASDSVGSMMTEVISIANAGTDTYQYYVSDYSNCTGGDALSYSMTTSNATIAVYSADGIVASYHVPMAHSGVIWKVFEIRNKKVMPINDYYTLIPPDSYWTSK